eukprot:gnl/TRDRNA2_/TRDRNA2_55068_c0_seq1.p1 gnl/TRDRNA2_/TRDRNA2_55068_c0~~gnl/TRDRNA2_/TRDRNA2_55068_c0_seq1.p1  ORF type:complete len:259 (+),score=29.73 gnl/TRDRNA2_/TRDRNA2_55068_c0_seq1:1-777(+)
MPDPNLTVALVGWQVEDAASRWHCIGRRALMLCFLLIGLGFAIEMVYCTNGRCRPDYREAPPRQDQAAPQFAIATARHFMQRPATTGHLMSSPSPWNRMQPRKKQRYLQPATALAGIVRPYIEVFTGSQLKSQLKSSDLACPGQSGLVTKLTGLGEFRHAQNCDADRILVFKFVAPHCNACKLVGTKVSKMAKEFPEMRFFEISLGDSQDVIKSLRLRRLPFVEMHRGGKGKLEGFLCGPKKVPLLRDKLLSLNVSSL